MTQKWLMRVITDLQTFCHKKVKQMTMNDFTGAKIGDWDSVYEIEFQREGMTIFVIAKQENYQKALDRYREWLPSKIGYYETGSYIKFGNPKFVIRRNGNETIVRTNR